MRLARALRLLLALALLVAWQNALVHPLAHVGHDGELVHLHGHDGHDEDGGARLECDAIAAVAVAVGGGATPAAVVASVADKVASPQALASDTARLLAYRSQAPPQHS